MLLFTPGPTPVLEDVRLAMAEPTIHHRTPEFEAIFEQTRLKLFKLFQMDEVLMLASSGTGAMEAAVINLCKSKALVVNSGKFGERFAKIVKAYDKPLVELKYEWNTPASLEDVKSALNENPDIDAIFIQVCESAGGLRHPVEAIAAAAKAINPHISVIADGITAVGVEAIDTTQIDCLITGSQKALMLPPGLAMMGLSNAAIEKIGKGTGYYFNLASEIAKQKENTTAYTAATTLVIGLNKMLEKVEKMGFDTLYAQTKQRANAVTAAMEAIGLTIYPKTPALAMTTIIMDDTNSVRKILKEKYGVNVAGGQDHLKGKIFRINQMGIIDANELAWVVDSVEKTLSDLNLRAYDGSANAAFNKIYYGK
jgi:aspartate aminotransferase-like enzyme